MIKNLIFDLGNVLISFKPSEYFDKQNYPESVKALILSDIFGSEEWLKLDNGEITTAEAIDSIARNSSMNKAEIVHIFNLRTDLMFPLDSNARLLPGLKKRGFRLYFLSNFPKDIFDEVRTGYYFFKQFDGGLISGDAKSSKPDTEIYKLLLEKYSLNASECLFIDDLEINVRTAESLGMKGIHTNGSLEISEEIEKAIDRINGQEKLQ
jgi:epoxide hydrolase-like predicted phosphatase